MVKAAEDILRGLTPGQSFRSHDFGEFFCVPWKILLTKLPKNQKTSFLLVSNTVSKFWQFTIIFFFQTTSGHFVLIRFNTAFFGAIFGGPVYLEVLLGFFFFRSSMCPYLMSVFYSLNLLTEVLVLRFSSIFCPIISWISKSCPYFFKEFFCNLFRAPFRVLKQKHSSYQS